MAIIYLIKFSLILIICACCICGQHVNCQQQKYKQLQYQMQQQQQQLLYQQQIQQQQQQLQQQQQHYLQQYEQEQLKRYQQQYAQEKKQQHVKYEEDQKQKLQQQLQQQQKLSTSPTVPTLQQHSFEHTPFLDPTQEQQPQMQMLQTSASLVVGNGKQIADSSIEQLGQKEFYTQQDQKQLMRASAGIRKRKRRPQLEIPSTVIATTIQQEGKPAYRGQVEDDTLSPQLEDSLTSSSNVMPMRRVKQPAVREPLAALEKEQKLYELRDKQRQQFVASEAIETNNKSYRRPYAQAKKDQQQQSFTVEPITTNKNPIDLKNILKNSGGLSLSEILQQKNLSLDDLIKGKQNALLALQITAASPASSNIETKSKTATKKLPNSQQHESSMETTAATDEILTMKPKLKFPSINRMKLFGTASRPITSLNNTSDATNKRTISSTTTTTTAAPSPSTRMPLYKKRQQLRTTLKPSALLKGMATTVGREQPTTFETTTTLDQQVTDRNTELAVDSKESTEENETTTVELPTYKRYSTTQRRTTFERRTTPKTTTSTTPTRTKSTTTASSSKPNSSGLQSNLKLRNNIRDKLQKHGLKSNIIDQEEPTDFTLTTLQPQLENETAILNQEEKENDDDLENFEFEESETKTLPIKSSTMSSRTSIYDYYPVNQLRSSKAPTFRDEVDDRTDLLELIEDRRSGNRLFKVLEQRNMTLEELIEHRKRGSSQLHLATIVEDNSRLFPEQKVVLQDNMDIVTAFENFPHFNLMNLKSVKPDDIKTDSQGSSYFTSIIDIEPTDEVYKISDSSNINNIGKVPNYQRSEKSVGFFPSWKSLASLASLATTARNLNGKRNSYYVQQPKLLLENTSKEELSNDFYNDQNETFSNPVDTKPTLDTVEIIENDLARAHDLLDLELSGHGFKRSPAAKAATSSALANQRNSNLYANMPAGIRSAIVASAAIVLTSIITFVVIFAVCRWKQRQQRRTTYLKTYNSMKSKLPTIATGTTTPRRRSSSLQNMEEMISSVATVSSTTTTPMQPAPQKELQRQCSLLFPRSRNFDDLYAAATANTTTATTTLNMPATFFKNHTNNLFSTRRCNGSNMTSGASGLDSHTGSTTSLALSLRSAHSISSTKLNAMDTNSPEVQEYLFDTLRKSYDN